MGALVEALTASSSDANRPTTNSLPELHGTPHTVSSGQLTSSPEKSHTKTQSPMAPSSRRGARCVLAYGEYGWPLNYSSKEKLKEYEEGRLTQWQIKSINHTLQHSL